MAYDDEEHSDEDDEDGDEEDDYLYMCNALITRCIVCN